MQVRQSSCVASVSRAADQLPSNDILPFNDINAALRQMRIQSKGAVHVTYCDEVSTYAIAICAAIVSVHNSAAAGGKNGRADVHFEVVPMSPKSRMTVT